MSRISVTYLDQYRLYEENVIDEKELISRLVSPPKPSKYMTIGKKFHKLLEVGESNFFPEKTLNIVERFRKNVLPPGAHELKEERIYKDSIVVGKADYVSGFELHEFKTTYKPFRYENYYNSVQWKAYCELFNAPVVHYHVFQLNENTLEIVKYDYAEFVRSPYTSFVYYDYLRKLIEFINEKGLNL